MYPGPRTPYNGYGPRYGGPFHRQMGPGPGRQLFGQMSLARELNTELEMGLA
jgi:hypothetical protein